MNEWKNDQPRERIVISIYIIIKTSKKSIVDFNAIHPGSFSIWREQNTVEISVWKKKLLSELQSMLYIGSNWSAPNHRRCKRDFLWSWPSLNSYLDKSKFLSECCIHDTGTVLKFFLYLAKANCTENHVCTSCDTLVLDWKTSFFHLTTEEKQYSGRTWNRQSHKQLRSMDLIIFCRF